MDGVAGNQNSYSGYLHPSHFYSGSAGPEDFKVSPLNKITTSCSAFPSFPHLQLKFEKERGEMLSFGKVVMNCLFVCSFPK